ncbi:MAG: molybdenum cofactor biosynthesis protein MoaE, partial [Spirochaetota bacterium]
MTDTQDWDTLGALDPRVQFHLQEEAIAETMRLRPEPDEGARLVFSGLVRDYNHSRSGVHSIEYHCYPEMARTEGLRVLTEAAEKFSIRRVHCIHRIGRLQLQETAIRLEIGSSHRLAALHACEYIMDQIK